MVLPKPFSSLEMLVKCFKFFHFQKQMAGNDSFGSLPHTTKLFIVDAAVNKAMFFSRWHQSCEEIILSPTLKQQIVRFLRKTPVFPPPDEYAQCGYETSITSRMLL